MHLPAVHFTYPLPCKHGYVVKYLIAYRLTASLPPEYPGTLPADTLMLYPYSLSGFVSMYWPFLNLEDWKNPLTA